jgi:hypothetical protein
LTDTFKIYETTEEEDKELMELLQLDDYDYLLKIFDKKSLYISFNEDKTAILVKLPHNSISFYFIRNRLTGAVELASANVYWEHRSEQLEESSKDD